MLLSLFLWLRDRKVLVAIVQAWRPSLLAGFLGALASSVTGLGAVRAVRAAAGQAPVIDTHMHVWSGDLDRYPFAHPWERKLKPPKTAAMAPLAPSVGVVEFGLTAT